MKNNIGLKHFLLCALAFYLLALALLFTFQRSLLYFPSSTYRPPASIGFPESVREFPVQTEDGLPLIGWYSEAKADQPTLVYFHGNADNLASSASLLKAFAERGFGILVVEYRAFSGQPGSPSENGLYEDARAFLRSLFASGLSSRNLILIGHSLGTGVATQMAMEFKPSALLLLAPFRSVPDAAAERYPVFPVRWLVKDRFDNAQKISQLSMPLFIANGDKDKVIDPAEGRALFALANDPKSFHFMPGKGHSDFFDDSFYDVVTAWIRNQRFPLSN